MQGVAHDDDDEGGALPPALHPPEIMDNAAAPQHLARDDDNNNDDYNDDDDDGAAVAALPPRHAQGEQPEQPDVQNGVQDGGDVRAAILEAPNVEEDDTADQESEEVLAGAAAHDDTVDSDFNARHNEN